MKALTVDEVKGRLYAVHRDSILLKEETYINTSSPATFVDSYGREFQMYLINVLGLRNGKPRKLDANDVAQRVLQYTNGLVRLDVSSFVKVKSRARFFDKDHGVFFAKPADVYAGKIQHPQRTKDAIKSTMQERYGVDHVSQVPEFALKTSKSANNSQIKYHWKTNEELVCIGSYEAKTVDYLNQNKINFEWQPKVFKMSNGKTYRPDFYLPDQDLWVEVKGWMRKDAQEKWDWFHAKFPNSELWNREALLAMNILSKRRNRKN